MVNTCAGNDPLCTEQVNKIYVYFFNFLSSIHMLSVGESQVVYLEHRTVALIFDSPSFDSGCAQEKGSN